MPVKNSESDLKNIREEIQAVKLEVQKLNKNFSALEELLRLMAANQMLGEVEKNLPKKPLPKVSANISSTPRNNTADEIFQRGRKYSALDGKENRRKAFESFLDAAERGHAEAMNWLADCYRKGFGTAINMYQYERWHQKYLRAMR